MKVTEGHIQAVLMRWLMNRKNHKYVIPNTVDFFGWEADLVSVTNSYLTHEYEVKLNVYDYRADAKKRKHLFIGSDFKSPAYFWYVTFQFDIEPPENTGWILISRTDTKSGANDGWNLEVKKAAPRLNTWKPDQRRREQIARLLSWKVCGTYERLFLRNFED